MKAKEFKIGSGEYAVVATYLNHNDVTQSDESTTIRTNERPRDKFFTALSDLGLQARNYFKLADLKIHIKGIVFTDSDEGHFVRLAFETVDGFATKIMPPRAKREKVYKTGEEEPDPENLKNIFLDAVETIENRITEYLNGDREQPELKPVEPAPEEKAPGLFGNIVGRIKKAKK